MGSGKKEPPGLGPEASEALVRLREGIARVRVIVSEARQAIGRRGSEGMLLHDAPDAPDAPRSEAPEPGTPEPEAPKPAPTAGKTAGD